MLQITIPGLEEYNEETEEFINHKDTVLKLEHSLVSISKWESKWHKSFLHATEEFTEEELIDYIKCMTITQNVPDDVYFRLTSKNIKEINSYIENPMSATWFGESKTGNKKGGDVVTSELIYYWMIAFNIPLECEKWHLNRLLTLIKICTIKNNPPKKMSKQEILRRNAELNNKRKAALNTRG